SMLTRRALLKGSACALAAVAAPPRFLARAALAADGRRKVLVAVFQRGAVDGLSMVVPYGDRDYAGARASIAIRPPRAGDAGAASLTSLERFDVRGAAEAAVARKGFESLYEQGVQDLLHGTGRETFEAVRMLKSANASRLSPANNAEYPRSRLGESLRQIAQLIRADVGLEIAFTDADGWDTHVGQGAEQG